MGFSSCTLLTCSRGICGYPTRSPGGGFSSCTLLTCSRGLCGYPARSPGGGFSSCTVLTCSRGLCGYPASSPMGGLNLGRNPQEGRTCNQTLSLFQRVVPINHILLQSDCKNSQSNLGANGRLKCFIVRTALHSWWHEGSETRWGRKEENLIL
jgi:hypothetical protein